MGKRLMILGAGPFQVPAIRKAAALGCHVITVDYLPDNVGHPYGHQFVNLSTVDRESILATARDLRVDGICTFSSDVAISSVAYVCENLGLPGASPAVAETMATKHCFRAFLQKAQLACPQYVSGDTLESIGAGLYRLKLPIVFKPVDTSGSRGITRLDRLDAESIESAFLRAQSFSRSNTVCVEEFIAGTEVGGDAILVDGRVAFIAITHKHMRGFVVAGHSLPTDIAAQDALRVVEHIEAVCSALGYVSGPLNFDVIVSADTVIILEMSARNGGNGIPEVIERATGVDVELAAIQLALGLTPSLPDRVEIKHGAGSFVFGNSTGGRLERICSGEDMQRLVPEVFHVHFSKRPGDRIEPFEHNGNLIGFALFDCKNAAEYERITEKISDALKLEISDE
ncbi:MAG: ATP-grasp domain-containing protein [Propionivibrio sp.]|nr:ATP-grasp domain-containing protein [Propionivibrio sp.]